MTNVNLQEDEILDEKIEDVVEKIDEDEILDEEIDDSDEDVEEDE